MHFLNGHRCDVINLFFHLIGGSAELIYLLYRRLNRLSLLVFANAVKHFTVSISFVKGNVVAVLILFKVKGAETDITGVNLTGRLLRVRI